MRLLHTSDWHLGKSAGNRSLKEDQEHFLDSICNIIKKECVDAVLVSGDIFDRSIVPAEAVAVYDRVMTKLCHGLGVKVLVIAGNHDSGERLASCHELLSDAGLYVAGHLTRECRKVMFEDTEIFLLPWITTERVRSVYPEYKEGIQTMEDAYRIVCDEIRNQFTQGKRHILMAHAFLTNAQTCDSDFSAVVGHAACVGYQVFEGFDYVALGHIHKPQNIRPNIRYSGSPMKYSFGTEEKQEKSVTIIDTETMEQHLLPVSCLHERFTLEGTCKELLEREYSEREKEAYVKVVLTDSYAGNEEREQFRRLFPNLLEIRGKLLEKEEIHVSMTMEELEEQQKDPENIFRRYVEDIMEDSVKEQYGHLLELFQKSMKSTEEETED